MKATVKHILNTNVPRLQHLFAAFHPSSSLLIHGLGKCHSYLSRQASLDRYNIAMHNDSNAAADLTMPPAAPSRFDEEARTCSYVEPEK